MMKTNQRRLSALATALAMIALTASPARAATMSASASAPVVNGLDISNFSSNNTDKWWNDNATSGYTKGQTFTTGTTPAVLKSVTFRTSSVAVATKGYTVRVGTVSGTTFTQTHSETATQNFTWNAGDYMKWTFATPIALSPSTVYGFDVGMNSSTSVYQTGIPYIYRDSGNPYSGGTRFMSGSGGGIGNTTMNNVGGDMVFHLDLQHPMNPSPDFGVQVPAGDLTLSWTNMTPTTGTDVWVDVWFGTAPGSMTKVASAQQNLTSFLVNLPGANTYYWRIDSYLDGAPTGTPVQSTVFNFIVTDSDGDGFPDTYELANTTPPSPTALNTGDDLEPDGLTNWQEFQLGTSPTNPDTDGDTLNDGPELTGVGARPATDPKKADTDGDGLSDGIENNTGTWASASNTGTNPIIADTDLDGLTDGVETNTGTYVSKTNTGTSPLNANSDGDNAGDWYEITASFTSPLNAAEKPNIPYPLPDPDSSTGATDKKVKVYIMSGQSNMLGIGTVNGTGDGTLETMTRRQNKFPNLVDSSGNYIPRQDVRYRGVISGIANGPLAPGQGSSSSNIGPELGFGQVMGWYHSESVLLIKSSIGNRGLGWDILPPGCVRYTYGANTYPAYGESPSTIPLSSTSWITASGSEGPNIWFAGKQFDDYFVHESDMGARPWVSGTAYPNSCQIKHNGVSYISTVAHTAAAATQPGVGANWATCWSPYSITNVVDVLDNWTTEYGGAGKPFAGRDFEIAGFVWWQGEKDGGDMGHATRYEQNLVKLITSLRTYYTNRYPGKVVPNAPFVLATLGEAALSNTSPAAEVAVRNAHFAVDSSTGSNPQINVKTVYSYPLSEGGSGNGHYNNRAGTYMLVGDALGRAMVDLESAASSGNTFANWMSSYGVAPGLAGFAQDADGDGIKNGVENFFGTAPNASSGGLVSGVTSGNTFTFTHPQNASPATGVTAAYRWSKDFATFRNGGQTDGEGTTVSFNAVTSAGISTVTATVTGTATPKLFVDVKVTQN